MEQLLTFIGSNPLLSGAFAVVLAALIATESARLIRKWKELDTQAAILLMNRQEPLILDASNSSDFAKAHILGAEHMPPSKLEAGNKRLMKSLDRPILLYCKNGQVSPQMATRMSKLGFSDVNVLKGGLVQWMADNQPVTRGKATGKKSGKNPDSKKKKTKQKQTEATKKQQLESASDTSPDGPASID